MKSEDIWTPEYTGARQRLLVEVLKLQAGPIHMTDLARRLGGVSEEKLGDRARFHNSRERRILTRDIKAINLSDEFPHAYIKTGYDGVECCRPAEIAELAARKKQAVLRHLWELKVLQLKAGNNENLRMEGMS